MAPLQTKTIKQACRAGGGPTLHAKAAGPAGAPEGAALVGVLSTLCMPSRDMLRSPEGGAARRVCSGDWLGLLARDAPPPGGWLGRSRGGSHESGTWAGGRIGGMKAVSGHGRRVSACCIHIPRGKVPRSPVRAAEPRQTPRRARLASSPSIAWRPSRSGASPNTPSARVGWLTIPGHRSGRHAALS